MRKFALAAVLLTVCAVAQAAVESPIHRTFSVASGGTLTLDTDIGDIRINPGGNDLTVDVRRRAKTDEIMREFNVTFDQSGNDVTIRAKYDRRNSWFNWGNDISA